MFIIFSFLFFFFFFVPPSRDIVLKLLQYEASTNVADNKGYFPIHLAAWKGDVEIVKILIHHGPSHSRVNEQVHLSYICSCYSFVSQRQGHIEELIICHYPAKYFFTAKFPKGEIETFFVTSISYIGSKLGIYKDTC